MGWLYDTTSVVAAWRIVAGDPRGLAKTTLPPGSITIRQFQQGAYRLPLRLGSQANQSSFGPITGQDGKSECHLVDAE
jgi:hypothetical protein